MPASALGQVAVSNEALDRGDMGAAVYAGRADTAPLELELKYPGWRITRAMAKRAV